MIIKPFFVRTLAAAWSVCLAGFSVAQGKPGAAGDYPNKSIRIVTSAPGGGTDFAARIIALGLSDSLRQTVIIENRSGAVMSGQTVAKAPPDGYTLLLPGSSFWLAPLLQKMPYDPIREFAPIAISHTQPVVMVLHPSVPAKSVKELIDYARSKPGELNYGSTAVGSTGHLATALFSSMTGVKMTHVPFKGGGGLVTGMLSGQVHLALSTAGAMVPHMKSGKLRGLGVASLQPTVLLPGLPTIASQGVPGFEASQRAGVFAPARTPPPVVALLNKEIAAYLNRPDIKQKFIDIGIESVGSTPQELAAAMKSEMARMGKVIKENNIRAEE